MAASGDESVLQLSFTEHIKSCLEEEAVTEYSDSPTNPQLENTDLIRIRREEGRKLPEFTPNTLPLSRQHSPQLDSLWLRESTDCRISLWDSQN